MRLLQYRLPFRFQNYRKAVVSPFSGALVQAVLAEMDEDRDPDGRMRLAPLVRIPQEGDEDFKWAVKQVLDIGGYGVILPHVDTKDEHTLFRSYIQQPAGLRLVQALHGLARSLSSLEVRLARLEDSAAILGLRGFPRMKRVMGLVSTELSEQATALSGWIPLNEGVPHLNQDTFYDVERDKNESLILAARVLLPNEYLGRYYYPNLKSACLLSATTRLAEGFEPALGFLGLDRAIEPAEDEQRPPSHLRTFSAPELFDYSRVLVGLPRDAPVPKDKQAHLDYLERFIGWLGERTRGRMLVLFTNINDVQKVGRRLQPFFQERQTALWYQGMAGMGKEELIDRFRGRTDSILLGVDTFWYGADFPGETLEYLVIARLPYGVPDRYHHAQCCASGTTEVRRKLYMPRALAKFRQGFGRLMRRTTDRGCVFILDSRINDKKHMAFRKELPLDLGYGGARLVRGESSRVLREGLAHMGMLADLKRRGLSAEFEPASGYSAPEVIQSAAPKAPPRADISAPPPRIDVSPDDLPF